MTSRLPPAFAATEYSPSLGSDHTHDRAPDLYPRPNEPRCRPPARLLYGQGSTTAVNVTFSESIPHRTGALPRVPPLALCPRPRIDGHPGYSVRGHAGAGVTLCPVQPRW